jgi:hypothetical protein
MDGLDLIGAQHLDRVIAVEGARERQLPDGGLGRATLAAPGGARGRGGADGGGGFGHDAPPSGNENRQRAAITLAAEPLKLYTASATLSIH